MASWSSSDTALLIYFANAPGYSLKVELEAQCLQLPNGERLTFDIPPADKNRLLAGLDRIGSTLKQQARIKAFEQQQKRLLPWLHT